MFLYLFLLFTAFWGITESWVCLLYRLSVSNYRECFILKGGVLLYAHERFEARPTLDIDFMAVVWQIYGNRIEELMHQQSIY